MTAVAVTLWATSLDLPASVRIVQAAVCGIVALLLFWLTKHLVRWHDRLPPGPRRSASMTLSVVLTVLALAAFLFLIAAVSDDDLSGGGA